jgi:hypothetical protein
MGNTKEAQAEKSRVWRELMALQKRSGQSVRVFCKEKSVSEPSFYYWRQRLGQAKEPVRFALVESASISRQHTGEPLELTLASGDRLRITAGTDAATLRMVLAVVREARR